MVNVRFANYLVMTLMELFLFGYAGNSLKEQSIRVNDAIYRCPWHLCGGPFRRNAAMMMANAMKPLVLTGGRFFVLDYKKAEKVRLRTTGMMNLF